MIPPTNSVYSTNLRDCRNRIGALNIAIAIAKTAARSCTGTIAAAKSPTMLRANGGFNT